MGDNWGLKTADIASILEACRKNGVAKLKLGDLEVEFGPAVELIQTPVPMYPPGTEIPGAKIETPKEILREEEAAYKADRLAMMFIEDPVEAERLIQNGEAELEDVPDGD